MDVTAAPPRLKLPTIRQLPTSVINKIAAGEVIERPASVVKELLENAVDAGARRIDVTLGQGGLDLIRIVDDGCGMTAEQLPLAIAPHATSKIHDADDLFHVGTLGFRGEALASIAEVSHLLLRSRTHDSDTGAELEVIGGRREPLAPCGSPPGTSIEVRNLFFNTPVRRKFMRASQTEIGHCTEAFTRIALAHERVHFTLRHNERTLFDLPPVASWRERIVALVGREFENALIPLDNQDGAVRLSGFAADPQFSRSHNRMQYLFLNGRHIRDKALQHALGEAYRGLLLHGRFPIAFLRLEMPADMVDVNVHPTKVEVRFLDSGRLYSLLLGTFRKRFLATDLTARVRDSAGPAIAGAANLTAPPPERGQAVDLDPAAVEQHRRELVAWATGALHRPPADPPGDADAQSGEPTQSRLDLRFDTPPDQMLQLNRITRPPEAPLPKQPNWPALPAAESADPASEYRASSGPPPLAAMKYAPRSQLGFQVHNKYLITESEEGMVVIDQHALHERILYEQFRTRVLAGRLETQRLLTPEPVALSAAEVAAAAEHKETLAQIGLEIEPFGGDTILISGYPAMLARLAPAELLRQAVDLIMQSGRAPERRDLLDELLHMAACKAAVKAGDPLSAEEITALLEQRGQFQDSHHCPHGRPTSLVFTREELDRRFKRT